MNVLKYKTLSIQLFRMCESDQICNLSNMIFPGYTIIGINAKKCDLSKLFESKVV